jgi:LuxR family maltose regulon positive regulatory protein
MRQGNAVRFDSPGTSSGVPRNRLLDKFEADVEAGANAIVLSASAGSGKTVTLGQWAQRRRAAGDLVAMVDATKIGLSSDLLPELIGSIRAASKAEGDSDAVEHLGRATPSAAVSVDALTRQITAMPRPLWIIIDDAHALVAKPALNQLAALLIAAQAQMRIAIGARHTPAHVLPKLIVDGVAREYRAADLAFDRRETRAMLLASDVALADPELDLLLERTAGWAAGLRLAAMALTHADAPLTFVTSFAGDDHAVADYLVTEVLSALPSDVVDLLLAVSVAEVISVGLAGVLSGRTDAGAILSDLEASNALVHRASDEPDAYQLHPLLRSYMRAEARRRDVRRHVRGHAVASEWFEQAGRLNMAVRHAASAEDWRRTEKLVAAYGTRLLMSDGPEAMELLLATLPPNVQMRPQIATTAALTAAVAHNFPAARLDLAAIGPPKAVPAPRRAIIDALVAAGTPGAPGNTSGTSHADQTNGDSKTTVRDLISAADIDPDLVPIAHLARSIDANAHGDVETAMSEASYVARIARHEGYDHLLLESLGSMCTAAMLQGDFARAEGFAIEALDLGRKRSWDDKPWLAVPRVTLAFLEWLHGRDEHAAAHAASAVVAAKPESDRLVAVMAASLVDIASYRGGQLDMHAQAQARELVDFWPTLPSAGVALNAWYQLLSALRARDVGWASFVVNQCNVPLADTADRCVLNAALHIYQGRDRDALRELNSIPSDTASYICPISAVVTQMLIADIADRGDQLARSHDALLNALELARASAMQRIVLAATPTAHRLLIRDRGRFGGLEPFVDQILNQIDYHSPGFAANAPASAILTERELDILRDLPSLLSLRDIAAAHVVSLNTVKTHLKAVYRKLGASNRREAVDHARELGLL